VNSLFTRVVEAWVEEEDGREVHPQSNLIGSTMSSLKLTYRSIANLHLTDKTKATQTKKEEKIPLEETVYTTGWSSISQIDHFPKFSYETSRVVKQW